MASFAHLISLRAGDPHGAAAGISYKARLSGLIGRMADLTPQAGIQ
jgi:hypothetical protein